MGVRWRIRWRNGVQSIFPNELRVLSPLLVSKKLVCECSHPATGEKRKSKPESLANRGLIKSIMAGCIAVIQKRLLDGNAHSIPAWERARIHRCTCAKLSKQRNYGTGILWAPCPPVRMCPFCMNPPGSNFHMWCVYLACVCVWTECPKINAHVHWVPLDAKPGGQVEPMLIAPPDAGRLSKIYFCLSLCIGPCMENSDRKPVVGILESRHARAHLPKGFKLWIV